LVVRDNGGAPRQCGPMANTVQCPEIIGSGADADEGGGYSGMGMAGQQKGLAEVLVRVPGP